MGFYEELAADYDDMTRFDERIEQERAMLRGWVERYHIHSAVDVACGTGLHAIVLAQAGLRVVGADCSTAMLARARQHAAAFGAAVEWLETDMQQINAPGGEQFDAVFCLGNSLPHLLTPPELDAAVGNFARLLAPGGVLALQLLNYARIYQRQERIVGIHRRGASEFVRFYDFLPDMIQFNVLTIHWQEARAAHSLNSTLLRPYQHAEILAALRQHGFWTPECFGDMNFHPFSAADSPNLVIAARRGL